MYIVKYWIWSYSSDIFFDEPYRWRHLCQVQKGDLKSHAIGWGKLNDHFAPKWFKVVMWHIISKRMKCIWPFRSNHFRLQNRSSELLAAKINFSEQICDHVMITLNDQNWRNISKYQLIHSNFYRKSKIYMRHIICLCYPQSLISSLLIT